MRLANAFDLRATVISIVLIPLLVVFGLGGFFALKVVERRVEARMEEDIALIARTLRAPLARSLERGRGVSLDRSLRSTNELGRVYGVYLYDANGRLIAEADRAPAAPYRIESLEALKTDAGAYQSMNGREIYSYYAPLTNTGGQTIGLLQVTRRASDIDEYLAALRSNVALITGSLAGLFVAVVLLGYHFVIGRPLQQLATAMDRVAGGDADARVGLSGPTELRRLANRFNSMSTALSERDAALRRERAEQASLERRLRQSEKYALVGRLAAGVAHELGTPLSVVDGHAQRLLRKREISERERDVLQRIREQTARMSAIVRELLGFGGDASPGRGPVPVSRLVTLAVADVRGQLEQNGVRLELVAASPKAVIAADEQRVREALVHVLRNAMQACEGGRVLVGWEQIGDTVRLFVENSGHPIGDADKERIFEPFYTTKAPGEGSGLGLAVVKSTIADHGGDIEVYDSRLGGAGFGLVFDARAVRGRG